MKTIIPVTDGNTLQAVQSFLRQLLERGLVEALLVPMRSHRGAVRPALVADPALLDAADPLAPVMAVNGATLAGHLSVRTPRAKVGVVLRPCELRALVELVKLQQASLDDLLLISVDCAGTYDIADSRWQQQEAAPFWQPLYRAAMDEPDAPIADLRPACQICEQPAFASADITLELFSGEFEQELHLSLPQELAQDLGLEEKAASGERATRLEQLAAARTAARDQQFSQMSLRLRGNGQSGLLDVFDACIRCHNCMTVCPICYCKTCAFRSPVFDHQPMQYMKWAAQKGALRLPADTTLFHLTRLNHMALSCVGCGMCTQACPADIPVGLLFRTVGHQVQQLFDYAPGRALEEELPLITFKENEWTELGETET